MPLTLNNSKDIICDKLFLLDTNDILQDVLDLIANASAGSHGITTLTGSGAAVISGTSTSENILVDLNMYTTTAALNTALLSYTTLAFLTSVLSSYTVTASITHYSMLAKYIDCWGKHYYFR